MNCLCHVDQNIPYGSPPTHAKCLNKLSKYAKHISINFKMEEESEEVEDIMSVSIIPT